MVETDKVGNCMAEAVFIALEVQAGRGVPSAERARGPTLSDEHRPTTINVRLARAAGALAWLESDTFVADEVVVPIELTRNDLELQPISSDSLIAGLPTINAEWHPVELAFALTDHKLQGATLQYLLLSLAERSFSRSRISAG